MGSIPSTEKKKEEEKRKWRKDHVGKEFKGLESYPKRNLAAGTGCIPQKIVYGNYF